jgi:sporulation protein YlmC with PRC-barrel domain
MTRLRLLQIGTAVLLAGAVSACESTERMTESLSGSTTATAPSGTVTTTQIPSAFRTMRGEDLIGKSVYNSSGERVGEIDDIVVNRNSRATAAVVGVGGFIGIGEKKVVVPLDDMRLQGDRIIAPNLTKDGVSRMQSYNDESWYRYERSRTLGELVR